jgi:Fe-S-cluster containining protein
MKPASLIKKCKQEIKARFSKKDNGEFMIHAISVFHKYTDQLIANRYKDPGKIPFACAKGCDVCCHNMRVEALPPEVFNIARHLKGLNPAIQQAYRERLENHAAYAKGKTYREYETRCPFLGGDGIGSEGACSIYEVRPHKCRTHLSMDRTACDVAGNAKNDPQLQQQEEELVFTVLNLYRERKVSLNPTELGQSVLQALDDETLEQRWLAGEQVFELLPEGIEL